MSKPSPLLWFLSYLWFLKQSLAGSLNIFYFLLASLVICSHEQWHFCILNNQLMQPWFRICLLLVVRFFLITIKCFLAWIFLIIFHGRILLYQFICENCFVKISHWDAAYILWIFFHYAFTITVPFQPKSIFIPQETHSSENDNQGTIKRCPVSDSPAKSASHVPPRPPPPRLPPQKSHVLGESDATKCTGIS